MADLPSCQPVSIGYWVRWLLESVMAERSVVRKELDGPGHSIENLGVVCLGQGYCMHDCVMYLK